jgi:hypothetical protein
VAWTSDDLVSDIRLRCRIPDGDSVASDAELRRVADDQISTVFTPLLRQSAEEYGVKTTDTAILDSTTQLYRIPSRATAGNLRDVLLVDGDTARSLPRIPLEEADRYHDAGSAYWAQGVAFCVQADHVRLLPRTQDTSLTLRIRWYLRPSKLIAVSAADVVDSIGTPGTVFDRTGANILTGATVDVIQANPNFDALTVDDTATIATDTVTLTNGATDVAVGDYLCPAGQSPIVQLPAEAHPVLTTACEAVVWQMLGETRASASATLRLRGPNGMGGELADLRKLLTPRVDGQEPRVINRYSFLRRGRM